MSWGNGRGRATGYYGQGSYVGRGGMARTPSVHDSDDPYLQSFDVHMQPSANRGGSRVYEPHGQSQNSYRPRQYAQNVGFNRAPKQYSSGPGFSGDGVPPFTMPTHAYHAIPAEMQFRQHPPRETTLPTSGVHSEIPELPAGFRRASDMVPPGMFHAPAQITPPKRQLDTKRDRTTAEEEDGTLTHATDASPVPFAVEETGTANPVEQPIRATNLLGLPGMNLASCVRTDLTPAEQEQADKNASLKRVRRRDFNFTHWNGMTEMVNRMTIQYRHLIAYCIFQREETTTGRPHWQGYIEFFNPTDISFVKNDLFNDPTVHVEIRLRPREECRNYCKKTRSRMQGPQNEVGPFEFGQWREQGTGQKFQQIREAIADGQDIADLVTDEPGIVLKNRQSLQWYQDKLQERDCMRKERKVTVRLFIGPTGTGKTHTALEEAKFYGGDLGDVFILDSGGKRDALWFDGYDPRRMKCMVIDDYDSWIQLAYLLRLLDKWPTKLQVKNSTKWANWEHVWITSNKPIQQWTDSNGNPIAECHMGALWRRLDWILYIPSRGKYSIIKKPDSVPLPLRRPELPTTSADDPPIVVGSGSAASTVAPSLAASLDAPLDETIREQLSELNNMMASDANTDAPKGPGDAQQEN